MAAKTADAVSTNVATPASPPAEGWDDYSDDGAHNYGDTSADGYAAAVRAFLTVARGHTKGRPRPGALARSSGDPGPRRQPVFDLPCRRHDPRLWFAETPVELERAKALCARCPIRLACLAVAVDHAEYAGVWGGHIFDRGQIVAHKRPRGRPRKHQAQRAASPPPPEENVMTQNVPAALNDGATAVRAAAARLYDAECALHSAHESHVDTWIDAANRGLHAAVVDYLAVATSSGLDR